MFKNSSFEEEIYQSMQKNLVKNQAEKMFGFNKLAKAIDYLNEAAIIFEQANMISEASDIVEIINSLSEAKDI